MMSKRIEKVNELIKQELSKIVASNTPDVIISIVSVETSADLGSAEVYVNVLGDREKVVDDLNQDSRNIRKELMDRVVLKKTPRLKFILNLSEAHVEKIDKLLGKARKK